MTNQEIIDSQVFRLLNHMIDEHARVLSVMVPAIQSEVNRMFERERSYGGERVYVRTYEEGHDMVELPIDMRDLERIEYYIKQVRAAKEAIGDLQRQKLRLLNDWDFTHGDDSEQKKIFG